jgi:hypothetical protein
VQHVTVKDGGKAVVNQVADHRTLGAGDTGRDEPKWPMHPTTHGLFVAAGGRTETHRETPTTGSRCGEKTRAGNKCRYPAMKNGRCRIHGGLSTGARTKEGIERIRQARWVHGGKSKAAVEERRKARALIRSLRDLMLDEFRRQYAPPRFEVLSTWFASGAQAFRIVFHRRGQALVTIRNGQHGGPASAFVISCACARISS